MILPPEHGCGGQAAQALPCEACQEREAGESALADLERAGTHRQHVPQSTRPGRSPLTGHGAAANPTLQPQGGLGSQSQK